MNASLLSAKWGIGLFALLEILLAAVVLVLAVKTTLLRDPDPAQPDFRKRAFSLAKAQLAFWTVVVIGCFIYVYFAQEICVGVLNNTALLLLGISTGTTALSAVAKPAGKSEPAPVGIADHEPPTKHENFVDDILSDNEGINIHRLQMVIWTVVFGGIFIHQVVHVGKFPTFDDQAYVLMGISSLTYVWFKRTEA